MVDGDDRAAAARAAAEFPADRATCFWDESRLVGRNASALFMARHLEELQRAVRNIPDLAERVASWTAEPELTPPAWDCAFFYRPGRRSAGALPAPDAWTKQFGFWMSADGSENGGTFWCDRVTTALVASSWTAEFAAGMRAIVR